VTPDGVRPGEVVVEGDRIAAVNLIDHDDDGRTVLPGLVDVHCHGGGGASFTSGDADQVAAAAAHHLARGTTALVGSAVTDAPDRMLAVVASLADGVDAGHLEAVHVEGPFLAEAQCGAHDPTWLRDPDVGFTRELLAAGRGHVRVVTLAPERPGADAVAATLAEHGVIAAVGHTAADAATTTRFLAAQERGWVTHLFNAMPPLHHRDPGPVLGSLTAAASGSAVVELVADDLHVAAETTRGVLAMLGPQRVAFVTDAMAAAGMPDGDYELGPLRVRVADGVARLAEGGAIAGGTASLLDLVRRAVDGGVDLHAAVTAASATPAALLGRDDLGVLSPGARADLVVTRDGAVDRAMRAGEWV